LNEDSKNFLPKGKKKPKKKKSRSINKLNFNDEEKAEQIPLSARIMAVLDVYNALTTDRPYRKALTKEKSIDILEKGKGSRFDSYVVEMFIKILMEEKNE
jgi:hypothetical protein